MTDTARIMAEIYHRPIDAMRAVAGAMDEAMAFAEITGKRVPYWFAQVGHESGHLRYRREIYGPTRQQLRYERRFDQPWPTTSAQARQPSYAANRLAYSLGNLFRGDGKRYMGRGWIQTTGRANYRMTTRKLREFIGNDVPDFVEHPALLEAGEWLGMSAALYWRTRNLNQWCDADDMLTLTKRINGGTNGLADRQAIYTRALAVLAIRA